MPDTLKRLSKQVRNIAALADHVEDQPDGLTDSQDEDLALQLSAANRTLRNAVTEIELRQLVIETAVESRTNNRLVGLDGYRNKEYPW